MMAEPPSTTGTIDETPYWRRSSACSNNSCVEVAISGDSVVVRDSKNRRSPVLRYDRDEWQTFIAAVKAGEFDLK